MISSKEEKFFEAVDAREEALAALSKEIWGYAELGLKEVQSSKAIAAYLEKEGFKVQLGVGSIPTAICAEYGSGHPVIAYLGEYDALPQLDQKVAAHKEWQHPERPESGAAKGTVRFYGCPAEETLVGKVFMVRDGAFKDVDCAMTWHSHAYNGAWGACYTCMNSVKFHFHGKAAHAAGHPFDGRSALDAVELMNVAANYMREHVKPDVRLHYSTIFNGAPNVVPDKCSKL